MIQLLRSKDYLLETPGNIVWIERSSILPCEHLPGVMIVITKQPSELFLSLPGLLKDLFNLRSDRKTPTACPALCPGFLLLGFYPHDSPLDIDKTIPNSIPLQSTNFFPAQTAKKSDLECVLQPMTFYFIEKESKLIYADIRLIFIAERLSYKR